MPFARSQHSSSPDEGRDDAGNGSGDLTVRLYRIKKILAMHPFVGSAAARARAFLNEPATWAAETQERVDELKLYRSMEWPRAAIRVEYLRQFRFTRRRHYSDTDLAAGRPWQQWVRYVHRVLSQEPTSEPSHMLDTLLVYSMCFDPAADTQGLGLGHLAAWRDENTTGGRWLWKPGDLEVPYQRKKLDAQVDSFIGLLTEDLAGASAEPSDSPITKNGGLVANLSTEFETAAERLEVLAGWIPTFFQRRDEEWLCHVPSPDPWRGGKTENSLGTPSWEAVAAIGRAVRLLGITDSAGRAEPAGREGLWVDWIDPVFPLKNAALAERVLSVGIEVYERHVRITRMHANAAAGELAARIPADSANWATDCAQRLRGLAKQCRDEESKQVELLRPPLNLPIPHSRPAITPALTSVDENAMSTVADLAERFGVAPQKLRKRLERWRHKNQESGHWIENSDAGSRDARYIYRLGSIRDIIDSLRASVGASVKRPSKK